MIPDGPALSVPVPAAAHGVRRPAVTTGATRPPGRRRWSRIVGLLVSAALAACVSGAIAGSAQGAVVRGPAWPRGVITYHVMAPSLRWPVARAVAEWNASGVKVRFVERPAASASLRIRPFEGGTCRGIVGLAPLGALPRATHSPLYLQRRCSRFILVQVAAHELGHVLGLGHENGRCAVMNAVLGQHCRFDLLPWEWVCHPLESDDVRGAIRLYGGRARPVSSRTCLSSPTPAAATSLQVIPDPPDSLEATRISWRNPRSSSLRRVTVNRRHDTCPTVPTGNLPHRPRGKIAEGEPVADVVAGPPGSVQSVSERTAESGTWCYAVWTMGPSNRYELAAVARILHPGTHASAAARIGFVATVAPAAGVRVRLAWTTPGDPALALVRVRRLQSGCPYKPTTFDEDWTTLRTLPGTPGATSVEDVDETPSGSTWCYVLEFRIAGARPEVAPYLVAVDVPVGPGSAAVAAP